jgi:colanic acid biosynthesis protein WcaH
MIREDLYKKIINCLPIVCVDIIIKNSDNKYLLVKRRNNPLKGEWWVVGGRIDHLEKAKKAAKRKLKQEINLNIDKLSFEGFYEDNFKNNSFENTPYHTISLIFSCKVDNNQQFFLDKQSSEWMWSDKLPDRFTINIVK